MTFPGLQNSLTIPGLWEHCITTVVPFYGHYTGLPALAGTPS